MRARRRQLSGTVTDAATHAPEVHARHPPSPLRQPHSVPPLAAGQIQCAAGRKPFHLLHEELVWLHGPDEFAISVAAIPDVLVHPALEPTRTPDRPCSRRKPTRQPESAAASFHAMRSCAPNEANPPFVANAIA
jgi:hypothetical protein